MLKEFLKIEIGDKYKTNISNPNLSIAKVMEHRILSTYLGTELIDIPMLKVQFNGGEIDEYSIYHIEVFWKKIN